MKDQTEMTDRLKYLQVGDELPTRKHTPDNVQLYLYNASLWNAHRIHFDHPYTQNVEGYPDLVIAGPLLGDWLNQVVNNWIKEDGRLTFIEYSNRKASFIGETLTAGGEITEIDYSKREVSIEIYIKNEKEEVIAPGIAVVKFN